MNLTGGNRGSYLGRLLWEGGGELFRGSCPGSKSPRGNRPKKISWEPVVLGKAGQGEMPGYPYLFEQGKPQKTYLELKV